jgi:YD repeat-containing protein
VTQITVYDAHGRPLTIRDPNGSITELRYDARGRLTSQSINGSLTSFIYDKVGNLIQITLPTLGFYTYSYDAAPRLTEIQDSLGNRIIYTLDALGNRVKEEVFNASNTLKRTHSRDYDALNRLAKELGGMNQLTQYGYDDNGNLISLTDPLNHLTTQSFDALNRLERLTDALEEVTQYRYDDQDQLVSLTDPKGLTTTYRYDGYGNHLETQSPDTGLTTAAYNLADRPKSRTDARGVTATLSYDVLNRLTAIDYPGSSEDVRFSYDQGAYGLGRLTQRVDESGTTSYAYNLRGLLKSVTTTRAGLNHTTGYGYTHGQLTRLTYPSGRTVDYTRDGLGRITTVTTTMNGVTTPLASNIGYSPFGPMRKLTFGNGLVLTRSFDLDYRLTAQTTLPFQNLSYTWDGADNLTAITSLGSLGSTQNFGYDALNRLWTAEASPYGSLSYEYDPVGNRLTETTNGALASYQYPPESHRLGSITGSGSQHFLYDENGNTVDNSRFGFVYGQKIACGPWPAAV